MSTRIVIEFEEVASEKRVEARRFLEGDKSTEKEMKLATYYLLSIGRGLAHFGLEQQNQTLLEESAAFVGMARDMYEKTTAKEEKA